MLPFDFVNIFVIKDYLFVFSFLELIMSSYLFGLLIIADASKVFGEFNAGNIESSAKFNVVDEDTGRLFVNEGTFLERIFGFLD